MKARWDAIAYSSRTVSDLEKEYLFHFTSLLCENPDLKIPVFSDVTFHHSPEDNSAAKTSKLTLRFKSGALIGSLFMVYKAIILVKTEIYSSILYQEGSITHTI